jgi:hypothetical protein
LPRETGGPLAGLQDGLQAGVQRMVLSHPVH